MVVPACSLLVRFPKEFPHFMNVFVHICIYKRYLSQYHMNHDEAEYKLNDMT